MFRVHIKSTTWKVAFKGSHDFVLKAKVVFLMAGISPHRANGKVLFVSLNEGPPPDLFVCNAVFAFFLRFY